MRTSSPLPPVTVTLPETLPSSNDPVRPMRIVRLKRSVTSGPWRES
jgi:hypothetical protein